ncbi:hypothetical protein HPB47_004535 [Ixodes persulcatus]|uniref:Uncharacterized protein n=1 Tax=Ixodes persulcatus TaxID=34615 RepID=A0AC60PFM9_IXOPE|nr:hypothetical protein HPB47_004535 [Ixodes persulcatus]
MRSAQLPITAEAPTVHLTVPPLNSRRSQLRGKAVLRCSLGPQRNPPLDGAEKSRQGRHQSKEGADTAGQERYIGLSSFYCRNADVAIMAFDITNRESYKALMTRYVELLHMVDDFALKVVVGTKTDLLKDYRRQVSSAEAEMFARNLNHTAAKDKAPYFETSSATGNNIETVFEYIVERCYPGSPMLSCCLRQTHEQEHKSVALTPRVLRFAKTTAGCCL